ncbi:MAG: nucleotidyltransferase family protein [Xanthobacteraceae bacterium]
MTRWDAFTATCGLLRAGLLGGERPARADIAWELMIEVASFHYVAPALAWCLRDEPMPDDVGEYFSSVAALNGQRNERMLAGAARVAALLNGIGIEPVLLKGCAMLAEGLYPDPSLRLMGDADILIPRERAAEAVAVLTGAGFATKASDVVVPPAHHHLQPLHDPETGLGVELHTDVMSRESDAVIATDWFCTDARLLTLRGHRVRVPAPTPNAGHCIFHSQIFHSLHARKTLQLRSLLDLALLRARHDAAIDWAVLDRRFAAAGFGEALATYLHFADALFGQPAPALSHAPAPGALAELSRLQSRDSFHTQIENLQRLVDGLQSELSSTMAARDRQQAETEGLRTSRLDLEAKYTALQAETERLRTTQVEMQAKHAMLLAETKQLRAAQADREAKHAALQAELAAATQARERLERDRADVLASRSWRWTTPLRALVAASRRWTQ